MSDFAAFTKSPLNRIAAESQHIDGCVFDGADGNQVAFWSCAQHRVSGSAG
jgi:hypothetical protein